MRRGVQEGPEEADGVAAAADAGDQHVRQATGRAQHLFPRLASDDRLELRHHVRVGVGAGRRAEHVEGRLHVRDPVAQCLVQGVAQGPVAGGDRPHLGAQQPHASDVRRLALDVGGAHVDDALQAQQRAGRGGGDAVLAGARLGDDPWLAHPLRQQRLAERVVDLVGAGVGQVLALEEEARQRLCGSAARCAAMTRVRDLEDRGGPTHELIAQQRQLVQVGPIPASRLPRMLQLLDGGHQRLGDVAAAVAREAAAPIHPIGAGRVAARSADEGRQPARAGDAVQLQAARGVDVGGADSPPHAAMVDGRRPPAKPTGSNRLSRRTTSAVSRAPLRPRRPRVRELPPPGASSRPRETTPRRASGSRGRRLMEDADHVVQARCQLRQPIGWRVETGQLYRANAGCGNGGLDLVGWDGGRRGRASGRR